MMTLLAVVTLLIVLILVGIPIYVALGGTPLMSRTWCLAFPSADWLNECWTTWIPAA